MHFWQFMMVKNYVNVLWISNLKLSAMVLWDHSWTTLTSLLHKLMYVGTKCYQKYTFPGLFSDLVPLVPSLDPMPLSLTIHLWIYFFVLFRNVFCFLHIRQHTNMVNVSHGLTKKVNKLWTRINVKAVRCEPIVQHV